MKNANKLYKTTIKLQKKIERLEKIDWLNRTAEQRQELHDLRVAHNFAESAWWKAIH